MVLWIRGMVYHPGMGKPYREVEHNGQPARLYSDGSVRNEKGHMLARLPGATKGKAVLLEKGRLAKGLDVVTGLVVPTVKELLGADKVDGPTPQERTANAGLLRAAKTVGEADNDQEAWGVLVEQQARQAMGTSRGATGAARFVGEATGKLRKEQASSGPQVAIQVIIGPELRDRYAGSESSGVVVDEQSSGGGA